MIIIEVELLILSKIIYCLFKIARLTLFIASSLETALSIVLIGEGFDSTLVALSI